MEGQRGGRAKADGCSREGGWEDFAVWRFRRWEGGHGRWGLGGFTISLVISQVGGEKGRKSGSPMVERTISPS